MIRRARRTHGFSLLEVLMATGILVGSLVVLSELAAIGRHHAEEAQRLTNAQAFCETRLNEILAGIRPAEAAEDQPVEQVPGWRCAVTVQRLSRPGLVKVQVTVKEDSPAERPREFTLAQWMRDPQFQRAGATPGTPSPGMPVSPGPELRREGEVPRTPSSPGPKPSRPQFRREEEVPDTPSPPGPKPPRPRFRRQGGVLGVPSPLAPKRPGPPGGPPP